MHGFLTGLYLLVVRFLGVGLSYKRASLRRGSLTSVHLLGVGLSYKRASLRRGSFLQ